MGGPVKLELRCPQSVGGIAADPDPDWSFDALLAELNCLETKIRSSSAISPIPFTNMESRELSVERSNARRSLSAFVMRVSDDEMDNVDEEAYGHSLAMKRFTFADLYLSDGDDLEDEFALEAKSLMEKGGVAEGALFVMTKEHQLLVEEENRNQISALETALTSEYEKSSSAFVKIEKYRDVRREMDRKLDIQYQRKIAEALDSHLTAIQRNHELKSQLEERKIRSEFEEVKRKEKALQEEKIRQEKIKAEAEEKKREEAKVLAMEAERKAKEAAEKEAADRKVASEIPKKEAVNAQVDIASTNTTVQSKGVESDGTNKVQSAGRILKAAESALKGEQERLQKFKELDEKNQALSNQDFSNYEKQIARLTKQITGTKDSVRIKSTALINVLNDPRCPQSMSIVAFAEKVVSLSGRSTNAAFACGYVIVLVTSQVPYAMDIILAEFHKVCIYTVPKHISYSKAAFESEVAYNRAIGYQEVNGKLESKEDYLKRLESCMKLYGALVQTEVQGARNMHGIEEGWAWLARFLNALPANIYTATALESFLQMTGFALYRRYKNQFLKILNVILHEFLTALKARDSQELKILAAKIQSYIEDKVYLQEPEGWRLQGNLLSSVMVPESEYHQPYSHSSNRYYN